VKCERKKRALNPPMKLCDNGGNKKSWQTNRFAMKKRFIKLQHFIPNDVIRISISLGSPYYY
jgi:hypothetical protein